jgi:DNA-binding HxlR family transcriptional regulator
MRKNIPKVYKRDSPAYCGLSRLADKWTLMIIGRLLKGPNHFGDLKRSLEGISKKVLAQYLRSLERDGLVRREENNHGKRLGTTYSLTAFGKSTQKPIEAVQRWAEREFSQLLANRAQYDKARRKQLKNKATDDSLQRANSL